MKKITAVTFVVLCISCLAWAQGITVTSPNGNETLVLGKQWPITWTANVTVKVKIQLIRPGGAIVGVIVTNLASDSSPYPWTIGRIAAGIAPAGSYRIRVIAMDGSSQDASDKSFTIAAGEQPPANPPAVFHPLHEPAAPLGLKFPRMEVSGIGLAPNTEGFAIIFSYKNAGKAAWPRASEVPVKPSYRVLLDGQETASGSLYIPAFPAQPGWEQWGYNGGQVNLPTWGSYIFNGLTLHEKYSALMLWHVGTKITVHINENKVMGMDSHELTKDLRSLLREHYYDLDLSEASYDWNTHKLNILVLLSGKIPSNRSFNLVCVNEYLPSKVLSIVQPMNRREFHLTGEVLIPDNVNEARFELYVLLDCADNERIDDFEMYDNFKILTCQRPL
jgi:hypothetical protein